MLNTNAMIGIPRRLFNKARSLGEADTQGLAGEVIGALRNIYDPELPVNIYDLGLIYGLEVDDNGAVQVDMTLTAPHCPVAETFPLAVETAVKKVEGVQTCHVKLVWEPPWRPERMSEAARLELGLF